MGRWLTGLTVEDARDARLPVSTGEAARLVMRGLKLEQIDKTVRIRITIPAKFVLAALSNKEADEPPKAP